MFSVLRLIIIIVTALIVFGWAVVAADAQAAARPPDSDVVLKAMPDTSFRKTTRRSAKYRTPFIIPISPPDFGTQPGPPHVPSEHGHVVRPVAMLDHRYEPVDLPVVQEPREEARVDIVRFLSRPVAWASRVVSPRSTHSKVVSVAAPNILLLKQRIAAHNLNVAATVDQLNSQDAWTLDELRFTMNQLQAQHSARQLLQMYWQLLDSRDQWRVGRLTSLAKSIELLRQRLFETGVTLDINLRAVTSLDRKAAESQLRALEDEANLITQGLAETE